MKAAETLGAPAGHTDGTGNADAAAWKEVFESRRSSKPAASRGKKSKSSKINESGKVTIFHKSRLDVRDGHLHLQVYHGLGKKILVFAHYHEVMDAIEDSLVEMMVKYIRIDGNISVVKRSEMIKQFQDDDDVSFTKVIYVYMTCLRLD